MLSSSKNNEDSDDYYNDNKQIIESAPRSLVERKISRFILQNGSYDCISIYFNYMLELFM